MRTRIYKKQFWFNEEEVKILKNKALLCGLNESEFIRKMLLDYKLKEKPDEKFYDYIKLLRSIANNINQIAYKANSFGYIDTLRYDSEITKVLNFIEELKKSYLYESKY